MVSSKGGKQMSRNFYKKSLAIMLILLLVALLAACSEESPAQTNNEIPNLARLNLANCAAGAGSGVLPGGVLTPNRTVPVPTGYRIFVSNIYPYAIAHPDGWTVRENQVAGNLKSDLIVAEYKDNSRAFVYVLSEKLDNPAIDSKAYFDSKMKELTATQKNLTFEQQVERKVAGSTAYTISFNAAQPNQTQSLQVAFVAQERGWVVTYSASPDLGQKYCGAFTQLLDTFTVTNLSK